MPPGEEIDREFSVLQPECSRATKPLPPPFPRCEGERDKVKGEYCPRETCASLTETPPLECLQIFQQSLRQTVVCRLFVLATSAAAKLARRREPSEVFSFHFLLSQRLANLLHLADMIDRIHLLDVHRIDVFKAKGIQAFAGKLGIVAGIGE
jgi:hypothetical protein